MQYPYIYDNITTPSPTFKLGVGSLWYDYAQIKIWTQIYCLLLPSDIVHMRCHHVMEVPGIVFKIHKGG